VTVHRTNQSRVTITGTGRAAKPIPPSPPSLLSAWKSDRKRSLKSHGWVPDEVTVVGSEERLVKALLKGKLRVVSDGSYKDQVGTAAVIIRAKRGKDKVVVRAFRVTKVPIGVN